MILKLSLAKLLLRDSVSPARALGNSHMAGQLAVEMDLADLSA